MTRVFDKEKKKILIMSPRQNSPSLFTYQKLHYKVCDPVSFPGREVKRFSSNSKVAF